MNCKNEDGVELWTCYKRNESSSIRNERSHLLLVVSKWKKKSKTSSPNSLMNILLSSCLNRNEFELKLMRWKTMMNEKLFLNIQTLIEWWQSLMQEVNFVQFLDEQSIWRDNCKAKVNLKTDQMLKDSWKTSGLMMNK